MRSRTNGGQSAVSGTFQDIKHLADIVETDFRSKLAEVAHRYLEGHRPMLRTPFQSGSKRFIDDFLERPTGAASFRRTFASTSSSSVRIVPKR
jgi:hypothetical protein